jgi:hypothetical protein
MQTLTLEVQDGFVPNLINYLNQFKNEVKIQQDENLKLDPYFYERQKKLHKIREDLQSGNMKLYSQEESDHEIELLFQKFEKNR